MDTKTRLHYFRRNYPQYDDLSDDELMPRLEGLRQSHYRDLSADDYWGRLTEARPQAPEDTSLRDRAGTVARQFFTNYTIPGVIARDIRSGRSDLGTADRMEQALDDGGRFLFRSEDRMRQRVDDLRERGQERRAENMPRYLDIERDYEEMAPWYEQEGLGRKAAHGLTSLGSMLGAQMVDPVNFVPLGRGATAAQTFARQGMGGAGLNAALEPTFQGSRIEHGLQDEFQWDDAALNVVIGGLASGAIGATPQAFRQVRDSIRANRVDAGHPNPDDPNTNIQEVMAALERDGVVTPEQLHGAIEQNVGLDRPEPLPTRTPEGRAARAQTQRELSEVFDQPEALRRDSVATDPETGEVSGLGQPLPRASTQPVGDSVANLRAVQGAADELGIQLSPDELQLAARDFGNAPPGSDPTQTAQTVVRDYSRRHREGAFTQADTRRQRRDETLADSRQAERDYQPGARTGDQMMDGESPVMLLDPRRDRSGRLVGGEQVEATNQYRQGEDGTERLVRFLDDGREQWVPASRLEQVSRRANVRMDQDLEARAAEPPRGVGETLSQPRSATDRITTRQPAQAEFSPEGGVEPRQPGPQPGPGPRGAGPRGQWAERVPPEGLPAPRRVQSESPREAGDLPPDARLADEPPPEAPYMDVQARADQDRWEAQSWDRFETRDDLAARSRERAQVESRPQAPVRQAEPEAPPARQSEPEPQAEPRAGDTDPRTGAPLREYDTGEGMDLVPDRPTATRLADTEVQSTLREMPNQIGYSERGGQLLRDEHGQASGRTKWLAIDPEVQAAVRGTRYATDRQRLTNTIEKAIRGEKLGAEQQRVIDRLAEIADSRAYGHTRQTPETGGQRADDFRLESHTLDDVQARQDGVEATQRAEADAQARAETKAQADAEVDDFELRMPDGREGGRGTSARQGDMFEGNQGRAREPQRPSQTESEPQTAQARSDADEFDLSPAVEPEVAARVFGLPKTKKGGADLKKRGNMAKLAAGQIDSIAGRSADYMRQFAKHLGLSSSGTKAQLLSRLQDWRARNTDAVLAEKTRIAREVENTNPSAREIFDRGWLQQYPEMFPEHRPLLRDTGNTGKYDWQKTLREYAEASGSRDDVSDRVELNRELAALSVDGGDRPYHYRRVRHAQQAGMDVPDRVLRDYENLPDAQQLRQQAEQARAKQHEQDARRVKDNVQAAKKRMEEMADQARARGDKKEAGILDLAREQYERQTSRRSPWDADMASRAEQLGVSRRDIGKRIAQVIDENIAARKAASESGQGSSGQRTADSPTGGGGTLYSGLPVPELSKLVRKVRAALGRNPKGATSEWFQELAGNAREMFDAVRGLANFGPQSAKAQGIKKPAAIKQMAMNALLPVDTTGRLIAKRYDSPTLNNLWNAFHAQSGRGEGVARTYDERFASRMLSRMNKFERDIFLPLQDNKLNKPENWRELRRLVENPRLPRKGKLGEIAKAWDRFFADELRYQRDAGIEVGEIRGGYWPRVFDVTRVGNAKEGDFVRAATRAYQADGMSPTQAREAAMSLADSVINGDVVAPGQVRPGTHQPLHLKSRTFSAKAAKHLEDFYINDPSMLVNSYVNRSARRAEIARTEIELGDGTRMKLGDNFKNWEQIEQAMIREDAAIGRGDQITSIRDLVAVSAGVVPSQASVSTLRAGSWIRTITAVALMPASAFAQATEFVSPGLRATTGRPVGDAARTLDLMRKHLGNALFSGTHWGKKSQRVTRAMELGEDLGIIAGRSQFHLMQARFAMDPVGRMESKLAGSFFRYNLMQSIDRYSRAMALDTGGVFLRSLARDMGKSGRQSNLAARSLRELGVPKGREQDFARMIRDLGDELPTMESIGRQKDQQLADAYMTAMQRFTEQSVMRPSSSTRPRWSDHPLGKVVYQLQAFSYTFHKNILNRPYHVWKDADLDVISRGFVLGSMVAPALALYGTVAVVREARDDFYRPDRPKESAGFRAEKWLSASGFTGAFDPYIQLFSGTRYNRSPAETLLGPFTGSASDGLTASIKLAMDPQSEADARSTARFFYRFVLEPMFQAGLAALPGRGVASQVIGTVGTMYGRQHFREDFIDAMGGEQSERAKQLAENRESIGLVETLMQNREPQEEAPKRSGGFSGVGGYGEASGFGGF